MISLFIKEPYYKIGVFRKETIDRVEKIEKTRDELILYKNKYNSKGATSCKSTQVFTEEEFNKLVIK